MKSLKFYSSKCILNYLHTLSDIGDTPYDLIKHILINCNSNQLKTLESNTPSLIHHDDEIWFKVFKQSFPKHYQDLSHSPDSWRQLFLQVESNQSSLLNTAAQRLRLKQQDVQNERLKRQTMFTNDIPSKRHKSSSKCFTNINPIHHLQPK